MTKEEKELLLKDLCARLPYRVKGRVYAECSNGEYDMNGDMIFFDSPFDVTLDDINISTEELHVIAIGNEDTIAFIEDQQTWGSPYTVDAFKPYLRPLSSMTEEEKKDLLITIVGNEGIKYFQVLSDGSIDNTDETIQDLNKFNMHWVNFDKDTVTLYLDWFNTHHIDYRGLIEKGLALEAANDMYKI
jgi:hypothetical protein